MLGEEVRVALLADQGTGTRGEGLTDPPEPQEIHQAIGKGVASSPLRILEFPWAGPLAI